MDVEPGRIVLHFDRAVAPPDQKAEIEGFAIAGADRHFHPAAAQWLVTGHDARNQPQIDRSALVLASSMVEAPIHFRFAWGRNPMGNLQSADHTDLPLATQRSDDWPMESVPLGVLADDSTEDGRLPRAQRAKLQAALRRDDHRRRLAEARALLEKHADEHPADRR
jgi:sialate O-acetylesterase